MKITFKLKNIKLFGYHGVFNNEKTNGQNFEIDIEAIYTLKSNISLANDDINSVINYSDVYKLVVKLFLDERYNLLESIANKISQSIINKYDVEICKVAIRKPNVLIDGELDFVEVEIENQNEK